MRGMASAVLAMLMLVGCATAGSGPQLEDLRKFARADVQRGVEIAKAHGDAAGVACGEALLAHIPEGGTLADALQPTGPFSTYMAGRELHREVRNIRVPEDVHNACAPLVLDAEELLGRLGLLATGVPIPRLH